MTFLHNIDKYRKIHDNEAVYTAKQSKGCDAKL